MLQLRKLKRNRSKMRVKRRKMKELCSEEKSLLRERVQSGKHRKKKRSKEKKREEREKREREKQ